LIKRTLVRIYGRAITLMDRCKISPDSHKNKRNLIVNALVKPLKILCFFILPKFNFFKYHLKNNPKTLDIPVFFRHKNKKVDQKIDLIP